MSRLLIGFAGYFQSGKDEAAKYLTESRGWIREQMSSDLWESLLRLNPFITVGSGIHIDHVRVLDYYTRDCKCSYEKAKEHPEIRRLLQKLGTECGRDVHGVDCWWKKVRNRLQESTISASVTGLRYDNEVNGFKSLGGIVVWIDRPSRKPDTSHTSEQTEWIKRQANIIIKNDREGDLSHFHRNIDMMIEFVEGGMSGEFPMERQ